MPAKTLYQPLLSTDVTFKLADITGFNGSALTASDFGTVGYGVLLNSDRSVMELFSWDPTTIASTSISFVDRGLPFDGSATPVTANKLDWPAGSTVLLGSDTPQFIQWLKDYIDGIAIAGAPNASTVIQGLVQESTQAQRDAGTSVGSTGAKLFGTPATERGKLINDYAVDAAGTDSYAITTVPAITAYAAGQRFTFKAGTANTGACTLNVCGLGAKTIKKSVSTDLETGDILANQIVEVEYDGTNMQILGNTSQTFAKTADVQVYTADATYTKPTGAKMIEVIAIGAGGAGGNGGVKPTDGTQYAGASGGGGGAYVTKILRASDVTSTVAVTVAPASSGAGASSSFGSYLVAYGGGAGRNGNSAGASSGGAGGGSGGVGENGSNSADSIGGLPGSTANTAGISGQGAGSGQGTAGKSAEYGGAGGGGAAVSGAGSSGGSSIFGGAAGGGGGGINGATPGVPSNGAAGGAYGSYVVAGGGAAGTGSGGAGTAGTSRSGYGLGDGGGGGAGNGTGTGGAGGAGGAPGGGGGGGGSVAVGLTGGAGGNGGRGEVRVITYF